MAIAETDERVETWRLILREYLARRHSAWPLAANPADGRTLNALRWILARLDLVTGWPHRRYLRLALARRIRALPSRIRPTIAHADLYQWELRAIDSWTVTWPLLHFVLVYCMVFVVLGNDRWRGSLPGRSVLVVCAVVSAYRSTSS